MSSKCLVVVIIWPGCCGQTAGGRDDVASSATTAHASFVESPAPTPKMSASAVCCDAKPRRERRDKRTTTPATCKNHGYSPAVLRS